MRSLRARLARIEAELERQRSARGVIPVQAATGAKRLALSAVWDVLDLQYPDAGHVHGADGSIVLRDFGVQALEASQRLQAGAANDADRRALAALPAEALKVLGWMPEEAIILIGAMYDPTMTMEKWRALPSAFPSFQGTLAAS